MFKQRSANVLHKRQDGDVTAPRAHAIWNTTMKTLMKGALTALLLASTAAPALAQQGGYPDGDPRNSGGRARWGAAVNRNPDYQQQQQAEQPQAQQPQQAQPERRDWNRGDGQRGDGNRGDGNRGDGQRGDGNRGDGNRGDGGRNWDRGDANRNDGDRGDRGDRNWDRGDRRGDGDGRRWDGNRGDQNWRRDYDWRGGRNWDTRRDWDRDRSWRDRDRDRPRYDRRQYAPIWRSERRFRAPIYRAPSGFYSRSWVYGDILPRGWYGPQYYILDWWSYGLPIPPAGYEWTRIGDDAVLVDTFSGRIVQVVYDLFW
jgi:Ni/Co efflux regulator RcnB